MIVINQNEEETMQYIKLQLGCLLVILYIMAAYVKATRHEKMSCNRIYDALMAVTPLAVIFDGITAWTINHMDIVPGIVNRAAHLIFYILMDLEILITALYMYDQTVGLSKQNRKKNLLLLVPGVISLVLTVAGIGQIYYVQGKMTNYSMGMSAYVCFATLFFYYGIILYLLVARHLFYGISMLDKFKGMGWKKPYLIFGMCDETFSINYTAEIPEDVDRGWFYFWVTFLNRFYWVSGATIGGHDRSASVETPDALVDRRWNRVLYAARAVGVCVKGGAH